MEDNPVGDAEVRVVRICAHRGLSTVCPENTLPAFASALAVGVDEIEFDVWLSHDGVAVVCHDETVDRTCLGSGRISDLDWAVIRTLDAGAKHSPEWRGVTVPRLEEVCDLVAGRCTLNIHVKEPGPQRALVALACRLIRDKGLLDVAYLAGDEPVLKAAMDLAPEIPRACLHAADRPYEQVRVAKKYACRRIQFHRDYVTPHAVRQARDLGLVCNLFWSDDAHDALAYVRQGIEVVLTNCAHQLITDGVRAVQVAGW